MRLSPLSLSLFNSILHLRLRTKHSLRSYKIGVKNPHPPACRPTGPKIFDAHFVLGAFRTGRVMKGGRTRFVELKWRTIKRLMRH